MAPYTYRSRRLFCRTSRISSTSGNIARPTPISLVRSGARDHQVRIKSNDSEYALYTVSDDRQEDWQNPENVVRMGPGGENCSRASRHNRHGEA